MWTWPEDGLIRPKHVVNKIFINNLVYYKDGIISSSDMISESAIYKSGNGKIVETTDKDVNYHIFPLKFQQASY
jgi:hypothetical protein